MSAAESETHGLRYDFFAEILATIYGTWRSLVARTLGVGEAPSSNLGVPTSNSFKFQVPGFKFGEVLT